MFERYTDRARRAVVLAQEEARMLRHHHIGTEHLLLGLIREGSGIAARALQAVGVSLGEARTRTEAITGRGEAGSEQSGHIPFTQEAKEVLELAPREAQDLGHRHAGTEHMLLGILATADSVGAQVLLASGVEFASVRHHIRQLTVPDVPSAERRAGSPAGDDLASRLASFAARLAAIERRLRGPALRDGELPSVSHRWVGRRWVGRLAGPRTGGGCRRAATGCRPRRSLPP